jgi:hypothetical protein
MVKNREWTDEEIKRLRELYPSNMIIDKIVENFPKRTENAIRQKASKLGIKRQYNEDFTKLKAFKFRANGDTNSKIYLINCNECGSWIQVDENSDKSQNMLGCEKCRTYSHLLAI